MIGDSPVIRAFRDELSKYFQNKKLEGGFCVNDGPDFLYPEACVRHKGRIWKIDVESIKTDRQFADELCAIVEWLTPVKPNPGAASHWKNQPPVDRIGRRPTWLSSSIPHGAFGYGSAS